MKSIIKYIITLCLLFSILILSGCGRDVYEDEYGDVYEPTGGPSQQECIDLCIEYSAGVKSNCEMYGITGCYEFFRDTEVIVESGNVIIGPGAQTDFGCFEQRSSCDDYFSSGDWDIDANEDETRITDLSEGSDIPQRVCEYSFFITQPNQESYNGSWFRIKMFHIKHLSDAEDHFEFGERKSAQISNEQSEDVDRYLFDTLTYTHWREQPRLYGTCDESLYRISRMDLRSPGKDLFYDYEVFCRRGNFIYMAVLESTNAICEEEDICTPKFHMDSENLPPAEEAIVETFYSEFPKFIERSVC